MSNGPPMTPNQAVFLVEFAYFLAIFLFSISIYLQTRKLYNFSFHRGIKYFRNAFFSFSMIFLFRLIALNLQFLPGTFSPNLETDLSQLVMFLVTYFSFCAIHSLLSSFLWKRYKFISDNRIALLSLFAACVTFFIKLPEILLLVGAAAAVLLVAKAFSSYRQNRQVFSLLFIIYALLLAFFVLDLVPLTQELMPFEFEAIGYVVSVCIFIYLNLKIKRVLAAGKEEK